MAITYLTDPYKQTTVQHSNYLEEFGGLKHVHSTDQKRKRVAILGAGISGLLAAFLLKHLGHDVHIYEASNTVGGRIKTLRDRFTADYYAEAGAMRIPCHHTLTLNLVNTVNLPCLEFPGKCPNGNTLFFINNHRFTSKAYEATKPDFGFHLGHSERGRTAEELFDDAILRHLRD
jgi:monoamine oxidase